MIGKLMTTALVLSTGILALAQTGCAEKGGPAGQPAAGVATAEPRQVDPVVEPYLDLRRLLVEDKFEGVPAKMAELQKATQALSDHPNERVKTQARVIAERAAVKAENLKEARAAYKGVSEAVIELVRVAPPSTEVAETLYVAYCPMAKASWLQTTKELSNPYMGQEMPKCGEVKETLKTRPA